jgi:hypothetical protein
MITAARDQSVEPGMEPAEDCMRDPTMNAELLA